MATMKSIVICRTVLLVCLLTDAVAFLSIGPLHIRRIMKFRSTPEGGAADGKESTFRKEPSMSSMIHPNNVEGNLYVTGGCIDCGMCAWMNPSVFDKSGVRAFVKKQPETAEDKTSAYAAMLACPVGAIQTHKYDPFVENVKNIFPAEIDPVNIPGVYHAGYHTRESTGATPFFIKRPGGNVLVGTPRFTEQLADAIEQEGGLRYLILHNKEPNQHHIEWKKRFPALERIVHRLEVNSDLASFEVKIDGLNRKWQLAPDLTIFHTPSYKCGTISVLYTPAASADATTSAANSTTDNSIARNFVNAMSQAMYQEPWGANNSVLFPGVLNPTGMLTAVSEEQSLQPDHTEGPYMHVRSLKMLAHDNVRFTWIMPSHGKPFRFDSLEDKNRMIMAHANRLDAERDKGSEAYESMLQYM